MGPLKYIYGIMVKKNQEKFKSNTFTFKYCQKKIGFVIK